MEKQMNYLDRNEFNFEPSQKVVEAIKNFDPKTLCFYTRIYDQGKKSVISVRLSEIYGVPEEQVLLTYGGEESTISCQSIARKVPANPIQRF